ncbi:hypothetical protein C8Q77DRAFT_1157224 [Trametes polyzona]|nr:hypothetical protein C8Q77DRAFT_1157224 [Trametes polyzona]
MVIGTIFLKDERATEGPSDDGGGLGGPASSAYIDTGSDTLVEIYVIGFAGLVVIGLVLAIVAYLYVRRRDIAESSDCVASNQRQIEEKRRLGRQPG